ncbi:MAG: hypothetical protein ABSG31_14685 [Tepidisphaeraceae bacterium]|jgi:hypothetical protein
MFDLGANPTSRKLEYIAVLIVVLAPMIRPGDTQWIQDEPKLIGTALQLNQMPSRVAGIDLPFTIPSHGNISTRGPYQGPLAVWFYQICLAFTHDPLVLMRMRALFFMGVTAWGLIWIADATGCSRWLVPVSLLSPWFWFYSRQLWDGSLCIPMSALALGAYGRFLKNYRPAALCLAIGLSFAMALLNLQTAALLAPMALHMLIFQWRGLFRYKWPILSIVVISLCLGFRYLQFSVVMYSTRELSGYSPIDGWFEPLLGFNYLSGAKIGVMLESNWASILGGPWKALVPAAQAVSAIVYPLSWIGMVLACRSAAKCFARRGQIGPMDHLALISLGVLVGQIILDGLERLYDDPHYFNTSWIALVVFVWMAVKWIAGMIPAWAAVAALAIDASALALVLVAAIWLIARDGGTRQIGFGTVLSEQIRAAQQIAQYDPSSPCDFQIEQWHKYPWACDTLEELMGQTNRSGPVRKLTVRYRNPYPDARITVDVEPPGENAP